MLDDILKQVSELGDRYRRNGSDPWFRGHRSSVWRLQSNLHRHVETLTADLAGPVPTGDKRDLLREEAKTLYRHFKADAWPLLKPEERSAWGLMFTMQHYGIPTRLLDWTESFACALFFAQRGRDPDGTAAVWVLDGHRLNEVSLNQHGLVALDESTDTALLDATQWHPQWKAPADDLRTIAVAPIFTNPRMTAQRSAFTLSGDSFLPLDEEFDGRLAKEGLLVKLELPAETFDEVEKYLRLAGITGFTFYPDLQGLAMRHEDRLAQMRRDLRSFLPRPGQTVDAA